jgi:D-arabinose 1-dehydrogenase-like Zn-dependent alcohol dehydrogenase
MKDGNVDDKLDRYREAREPIPATQWLLPLYGKGFESLGRDGQPIQTPVPGYGPDELLVRHDACGLCFSDVKVIRAGEAHPRVQGRDLKRNPVVLGHEVSLTVVGVGANLRDQFAAGQRFLVQADVYYKGKNLAYGYALQGGLSQYNVVGDEVLRGDHGCYLLPVQSETGYAQAALTEPWACVEAAYTIRYRQGLRPGGVAWFVGTHGAGDKDYCISSGFDEQARPDMVVLDDVPPAFAARVRQRAAALGAEVIERNGLDLAGGSTELSGAYTAAVAEIAPGGVDDAVVLGPARAELVTAVAATLARGGILNLVSDEPLPEPVNVDVGRLHYDHITIVGGTGPDIAASYQPVRSTLRPGGRMWVLGAAGPMGHMHVQRAIEMTPRPQLIVATNLRSPRISEVADKFAAAAEVQGIELVCLTEAALRSDAFEVRLRALSEGQGFDDIVVLAPDTGTIEAATAYLAPGGVMNLFVGLPRGTMATLDLNPVRDQRQVRFVGSSGSSIEDMQRMLELAESGTISPNRSVAAIAGLAGTRDGLQAVSEGRFSGKVVVYPHLVGLGLTPLSEMVERLPDVHPQLEDGRTWTNAAEEQLLHELL